MYQMLERLQTRVLGVFLLTACFFSIGAPIAEAGFGITPPYVSNSRLTRGTTYEQKITLVRNDPDEDLTAQVSFNTPGIESWITIDRGTEFALPKGETQVPIVVTVTVPKDAEYKEYNGTIRIRTSSASVAEGSVSIALGAQISVDLAVVDKVRDFELRKVTMTDLEEGRRKWGLFFPAKIRFFMTVENTGNVDYGPTKVKLDIYDSEGETLLETVENTNKVEKVAPFATKEVLAELPTRLAAGHYVAKYTVYKDEEVAGESQVSLSIQPLGTVPGYEGYGFGGLSIQDKAKVIGVIMVGFFILLFPLFLLALRRRRRK